MGIMHKLLKIFSNFKGLDERTSNITESSENASDAINVKFRKDGGIAKRNGYHTITNPQGGKGNAFYYETNKDNGVVTESLLTMDDNLHKLKENSFTLAYNETNQNYHAHYIIKANDVTTNNGIILQIIEDRDTGTDSVYTYELGTGKETSPVTLANLETWLEGTGDGAPVAGRFSMSTPTDTSHPAAFLQKIQKTEIINGNPLDIKYYTWDTVSTGGSNTAPFTNAYSLRDNENSENYSVANLNEIAYISTGFDDIQKYDGNRVYNAGMKKASTIKINGYEGGGADPVHTSGELNLTHYYSTWVDTTSGSTYSSFSGQSFTWTFSVYPGATINLGPGYGYVTSPTYSGTISNKPRFVQDTPEIIISQIANSGAGNAQWTVRVRVKRQQWAWKDQTFEHGNMYHYHPSATFSSSVLGIPWSFGSVGSPYNNMTNGTSFYINATPDFNVGTTSFSSSLNITPGFPGVDEYSGSPGQGVGYIYDSDLANSGYMARNAATFTVEAGVTTVQELVNFLNSHGTLSYDTSGFTHPNIAGGATLNNKFGSQWGSATGSGTKNILDASFSGSLTSSDKITELETGTISLNSGMVPGFGHAGNWAGVGNIDASSSTAQADAIAGTGPFYAPIGETYCSILQENGSPYPDQTSCEAAGGTWVDSGAGSCSNGTSTDYTSCTAAGGTWTWAASNTAVNQYNEWRWKMTYMQKDAKGNITTGDLGDDFKLTLSVNPSANQGTSTRYANTGTVAVSGDLLNSSEYSMYNLSSKGLKHMGIDVPNIPASEGFNTACGIVNIPGSDPTNGVISTGTDNGTNIDYFNSNANGDYSAIIPLKEGHTFQAGDVAYFKDLHRSSVETNSTGSSTDATINSISGSQIYREFLITATTSTSITVTVTGNSADDVPISGEESHYFTICANQPISNNLRAQIWRTKNLGYNFEGDPVYHLVEEIPVQNLEGSKQSYKDQFKDADLGPAYEDLITLPALTRHYPLPKGKYLSTVSNTLVIAGNPKSVGTLYKMEPGHPEIYTGLGSFFTVSAEGGGEITGLGTLNKVLYVFQKKAINGVSGDMSTGQIRIDIVSNANMGIGCESHHTIKEVKGKLNFLSEKGLYSVAPGMPVEEVSALIAPLFDVKKYNFKQANSANWNENDLYFTVLPTKDSSVAPTLIIAYDTYRDAWTKWENLDFSNGIAVGIRDIYFTGKSIKNLYKFQQSGNSVDYADHDAAISLIYKTNWEALGDATVPKRFLRLKAFSIDSSETFETDGFILKTSTEKDYDITPVAELDFDFNKWAVDGWGESAYDATGWGDNVVRNKYLKSKLSSKKCKSLRLTFKNQELNKNALLSGYELEIVAPYRPEIKE